MRETQVKVEGRSITREGGRSRVRGVSTREGGGQTREGGESRVKGGKHVRGTVAQVEKVLNKTTSEAVMAKGLALYNKGLVHETDRPWVFNVGSESVGLFGYQVDLSMGACQCKGGQYGRVCKHVVAAGVAFFKRGI